MHDSSAYLDQTRLPIRISCRHEFFAIITSKVPSRSRYIPACGQRRSQVSVGICRNWVRTTVTCIISWRTRSTWTSGQAMAICIVENDGTTNSRGAYTGYIKYRRSRIAIDLVDPSLEKSCHLVNIRSMEP
jgi:hypothetical protein